VVTGPGRKQLPEIPVSHTIDELLETGVLPEHDIRNLSETALKPLTITVYFRNTFVA
jgi:hypothetical protein